MKRIVYVTGCLGFIGSHVTRLCLNKGWFVRGIDKQSYAANVELLKEFNKFPNFSYENKDINDIIFLYDCDYIINTAAETHVDNSISRNDVFIKSNICGVHNLLELIRVTKKEKLPVLIHFSTDEVYGDLEYGSHTEECLLKPSNPYSASKAAADQLVLAWNRTYGIPYIIVRPTNNYGVGQYIEKLIPKSIKYLQLGRKIPLHNNGTPKRTWLHVEDTANGVIHIIESGVTNCIFNIPGNEELRNIDVVEKIVKIFHGSQCLVEDFVNLNYNREGQDIRYSIDGSKLKSLGWDTYKIFDKEIINIVNSSKEIFRW